MLLLVGFVAGGAYQATPPGTVEAERFVIKGKDGRIYGEMGIVANPTLKTESARLTFRDAAGTTRLDLELGTDGTPDLSFRDQDGRTRVALNPSAEGSSLLNFYDKAGWGQLTLGAWPDAAGVKLYGPSVGGGGGSDHGGLLVNRDGSTRLNFFTPGPLRAQGVEMVNLGVDERGRPHFTLSDMGRLPLFQAP